MRFCVGNVFKLHQHLMRKGFSHKNPLAVIEILETEQRLLDTSKVNNTNPTSSKPEQ